MECKCCWLCPLHCAAAYVAVFIIMPRIQQRSSHTLPHKHTHPFYPCKESAIKPREGCETPQAQAAKKPIAVEPEPELIDSLSCAKQISKSKAHTRFCFLHTHTRTHSLCLGYRSCPWNTVGTKRAIAVQGNTHDGQQREGKRVALHCKLQARCRTSQT